MDKTIDMAREAGFAITVSTDPNSPPSWWTAGHDDRFKAFEALVRADEREACAVLFNQPHMEYFGQEIQGAIRARGNT
jgi:beta-galactosidase GanA